MYNLTVGSLFSVALLFAFGNLFKRGYLDRKAQFITIAT